MLRFTALTTVAGLALAIGSPTLVAAQSTCALPLAAYLTDATGAPLDGVLDVEVRFYVDGDVDALPVECRSTSASLDGGWLRFLVDACSPPDPEDCGVVSLNSVFASSDEVWVGIRVGDDEEELSPRQLLGAVPYSIRAGSASHAETADVATALEGFNPADYATFTSLSTVATTGSFDDLADVPDGLSDGDDDSLGALICDDDQLAVFDADVGGWVCGETDPLGRLVCSVGDVAVFDGVTWVCGSSLHPGGLTMTERLDTVEELLSDSDGDGWFDLVDNCPEIASADLTDTDGDGVGDICDECEGGADTVDTDDDGVADACDRCPGEDDALDADGDGFPDCLGDGTDFGGWTWVEGPRGGSCLGVCETIGLTCVSLAGTGWVETAESNICNIFYPGLSTRSDGDGPRLSVTNPDGSPSPSSQCVYHSHDWSGATCAWVERTDDVRFCPCE